MDPKSIAHLDPKLQETYTRVMGTSTSPKPADQPAPSSDSNGFSSTDLSQISTAPTDATPSLSDVPSEAHALVGSEPSLFSASPPSTDPHAPSDLSSPTSNNNSFFTNTSPAAETPPPSDAINPLSPVTPPPSTPTEATSSETTVTPYTPTGSTESQEAPANQPLTQPLQSPAEVNQANHRETSPILKVLYIVGAIIFFAIYTIFWVKVFNLPFLF